MKKIIFVILPLIFTAGACDFLFGGIGGKQGSGPRGIFLSTDSGQTWTAANKIDKNKSLENSQISQIVFDRLDTRNLMLVTLNGGIYASDSGGERWFSVMPNLAGYDGFLNPNNREEIFVAGSRNQLAAILKSTDAGVTWTQIYHEPQAQAAVTSLVYDPQNSAVIYAGLSTGTILKSLDAGRTWSVFVDFQDRIVKLLLTPDGRTIYLLERSQGIKRSADNGKTWTTLTMSEPPGQYFDLIFEPGNTSGLYLATDKGLFKSQDGGGAWVKLSLPAAPEVSQVTAIAVNPQNRRQIFAAVSSTIYRSDDYGVTWRTVPLATNRIVSRIAIDPAEPSRIYIGLK